MRLLLDTHVFLWGIAEPEKLPERVQAALRDETNELLVSAASLWEIALKVRAGKLRLPETSDFFAAHLGTLGRRYPRRRRRARAAAVRATASSSRPVRPPAGGAVPGRRAGAGDARRRPTRVSG